MNDDTCHTAGSNPEPASVQFIQREFASFLTGCDPGDAALAKERFQWIHDRIFVDGWNADQVRQALIAADRRGRIIAVTSGKGGVGKTTISLNTAVAFAQAGHRTLLFDGDFGLGNVHVIAGINPSVTILDVLDGGISLKDVVIEGPSGLKLICGASGVARLAAIDRRQLEQLGSQIWQLAMDFDVVVLDTAAGIGMEVLSLLALADEIVVVATPNVTSTLDAYGVIKASHEARIGGRLGVLANHAKTEAEAEMVRSRLSNCAKQFLGVSLRDLGWLPRAPRLEAANRNRQPVLESSPGSDVTRRFRALAASLLSADGGAPAAEAMNQSAAA